MPITRPGCQSAPKLDYPIESASVAAAKAARAARTTSDADTTRNLRTRRKPNSRYQDSDESDEDILTSASAAAAAMKRQKVRYAADVVNGRVFGDDEDEMAAAAAVMAQMAEAGMAAGGRRRMRPDAARSAQLPPEMARQRVEMAMKPPGLYSGGLRPAITYGKMVRVQPLLPVVPAAGAAHGQAGAWPWMQQQGPQAMPPGGVKPGTMASGGLPPGGAPWQGQGPQGSWGQAGQWEPKQEYSSTPQEHMQQGTMPVHMMQQGPGQQGMGRGPGYGPGDGSYSGWPQGNMGPPTQQMGPQYGGPQGPGPGVWHCGWWPAARHAAARLLLHGCCCTAAAARLLLHGCCCTVVGAGERTPLLAM
jgi:hypothetical protein